MIWQSLDFFFFFPMDSTKNAFQNSQNNRDKFLDIYFVWGENLLAVPGSVLSFHPRHETIIRADSLWVSETLLHEICQLKNILWKNVLLVSVLQSLWDSGACLCAYTKLWFWIQVHKAVCHMKHLGRSSLPLLMSNNSVSTSSACVRPTATFVANKVWRNIHSQVCQHSTFLFLPNCHKVLNFGWEAASA